MSATFLLALCARPILHGYALKRFRRHRDLISRDEMRSICDEGIVEATRRFDPTKGSFLTFARFWVDRYVLRAVGEELAWQRQRVGEHDEPTQHLEATGSSDLLEDEVAIRQLMSRLDVLSCELWCRHHQDGETLRELSAAFGLSLRKIRNELARADSRITQLRDDSPIPPRVPVYGRRRTRRTRDR